MLNELKSNFCWIEWLYWRIFDWFSIHCVKFTWNCS